MKTNNKQTATQIVSQILVAFIVPRTPTQVGRRLGIKKLKMKPFVDYGFVRILNPESKKGRLYTITEKGRRLIGLPVSRKVSVKKWKLAGYVMASPKQRLVVLRVMDSTKRTSEDIRSRASKRNPCMTRISTKGILKELIQKGLAVSEMFKRKRCYWITEKGKFVLRNLGYDMG